MEDVRQGLLLVTDFAPVLPIATNLGVLVTNVSLLMAVAIDAGLVHSYRLVINNVLALVLVIVTRVEIVRTV